MVYSEKELDWLGQPGGAAIFEKENQLASKNNQFSSFSFFPLNSH
jgi:hypothetical protein